MEDLPGYDAWKLSTPWDDEKEISIAFDCSNCEEPNEQTVTVGRSLEWETECSHCGETNSGDESE